MVGWSCMCLTNSGKIEMSSVWGSQRASPRSWNLGKQREWHPRRQATGRTNVRGKMLQSVWGERESNRRKELAQTDRAAGCGDGRAFCFLSCSIFLALAFLRIKLCRRVSDWKQIHQAKRFRGALRRWAMEGHSLQQELVWSFWGWFCHELANLKKTGLYKVFWDRPQTSSKWQHLVLPQGKPNYSLGELSSVWLRALTGPNRAMEKCPMKGLLIKGWRG